MTKLKTIVTVLSITLLLSGIAAANLSNGVTISDITSALGSAVITILGSNPATVERYTTYTDYGANANDSTTGASLSVVTSGLPIATLKIGTHNVTYSAVGDDGNTVAINRTVHVVDTTAPEDVTNLHVTATTSNSVSLAWDNPDNSSYPNQDFVGTVLTVTAAGTPVSGYNKLSLGNVTSYTITNLNSGTAYNILLQSADDQEAIHSGNGT